jgi:hypothetical protein
MKASPFEPEVASPGADGPPGRRGDDVDPRPEVRAAPDGENEDQTEEMADEPGYGHGV